MADPWSTPPARGAGCPFGPYRLVVEAWGVDPEARRYGDLNYGDGFYGDPDYPAAAHWLDLTDDAEPHVITRGDNTGNRIVPADEIDGAIRDDTGRWFPMSPATIAAFAPYRVGILAADEADNYLTATVGTVSTPAPGPLPTEFTIIAHVHTAATPGIIRYLAGQDGSALAFHIYDTLLYLQTSVDNVNRVPETIADLAPHMSPGTDVYIAGTMNLDAGGNVERFAHLSFDGITWEYIPKPGWAEYPVAAFTPYLSSQPMRVGANGGGGDPYPGRIYSVELRTGLDPAAGDVVWRFDANEYPGSGSSYVDPRGRTWTLTNSAAITVVPRRYWPIATGRIARIIDVHDAPVRTVAVEASGMLADLAVTVPGWRDADDTGRIDTILPDVFTRAAWAWAPLTIDPRTSTQDLAWVDDPPDPRASARAIVESLVSASGGAIDTNAHGAPRVRRWPIDRLEVDPVRVADCPVAPVHAYLNPAGSLVSTPDPGPLPTEFTIVAHVYGPTPDAAAATATDLVGQWDSEPASWVVRRYVPELATAGIFYSTPTGAWGGQRENNFGIPDLDPDPDVGDLFAASIDLDEAGMLRTRSYHSTDQGATWVPVDYTELSPPGYTAPFDASIPLTIGGPWGYWSWRGRIYSVELRTGLDPAGGDVVWRFDADEYPGSGTSYVDPRGRTWNVSHPTGIVPAVVPELPAVFTLESDRLAVLNRAGVYADSASVPDGSTPASYVAEDVASVGPYGPRDTRYGFPVGGPFVFTKPEVHTEPVAIMADRAVAAFGRSTVQVSSLEVDTAQDARWFDVLPTLDLGSPLEVVRYEVGAVPLVLECWVVGMEHRPERDRWRATLYLSTDTPTLD